MTKKRAWDEIKNMIMALEKETHSRKRLASDLIRACRESMKKHGALVENSPDFIYILDVEGNFIFVGGAVESLLGFASEELVGKHFTSIIWPADSKKTKWRFNDRRTGNRSTIKLEVRLATKKGKRKDFDIRYKSIELYAFGIYDEPVSAKHKQFFGTYGVARDITSRKQAENALKRSEEKSSKESNKRKILSQKLIETLEGDHRQVAMELHDQIGQTLTTLKMDLETVGRRLEKKDFPLKDRIDAAKEKVIQALGDIRDFSYDLRPVMLDTMGLVPSLRDLLDRVENDTGIEIDLFTKNITKRFNPEKELALYRIAQEAMNNIVTHARAQKVSLNLVKTNHKIVLRVEDDGTGFDPQKATKVSKRKGPLGLLIMEERALQVGGKFTIESRPGSGTYLMCEIPI